MLILSITLACCALGACGLAAWLSRHKKAAVRDFDLPGRAALVVRPLRPEGAVLIEGELWRAVTRTGEVVESGERVCVAGARGHLLEVE